MTKLCSVCGMLKEDGEFYSKADGKLEGFCKACKSVKSKQRRVEKKIGTYEDLTTREVRGDKFKVEGRTVHGDTYKYDRVNYVNQSTKVEIYCTKHGGYFWQSPHDHTAGNGCKDCGVKVRSEKRALTQDEFLSKSIVANSNKYNYSKAVYINNNTYVTIICPSHGDQEVLPAHHFNGRGCVECSREELSKRFTSNLEEWVPKGVAAHGDGYNYSKSVYVSATDKMWIHCNTCGTDFEQTPSDHTSGSGCSSCCGYGYNRNKAGYLYLLSCGDITKIGITNSHPTKRAKEISKDFGAEFLVVRSWMVGDGSIPDDAETKLLRELRKEYEQPSIKFDGYSECFLNVDYNRLVSRIEEEIFA